jgi:hypothetical protein
MCKLNEIELAWAKIKHYICENNTVGDLSTKALQEETRAAVGQVWLKTGQSIAIM